MISCRRPNSLMLFGAGLLVSLILSLALSVPAVWAQSPEVMATPQPKLPDCPDFKVEPAENLSYQYDDLTAAGGFQILVASDAITNGATVTAHIIDDCPSPPGDLCVDDLFAQPVEVSLLPRQWTVIRFDLISREEHPHAGTYKAWVQLKATSPLLVCEIPLTIQVSSSKLNTFFTDATQMLTHGFGTVSQLLIPLLAWFVLLWFLYHIIRRVVGRFRKTDLGPVKLNVTFTSESGETTRGVDKQNRTDFEALLKQRLEKLNLRPPATQPGASIDITDLGTIAIAGVFESSLKLVQILSKIVDSLSPSIGHEVECIVCQDTAHRYRLILDIKSIRTGATDVTGQAEASSLEDLALKAACIIYLHVFHDCQERWAPKWQHFNIPEGLEHYLRGIDRQKDNNPDTALDEFRMASRIEPGNILTRLAAASLLRERGEADEAIAMHSHILRAWPDLIEPRYRLVAGTLMKYKDGKCDYKELTKRLSVWSCSWKYAQKFCTERGYWKDWAPWRDPRHSRRLQYLRLIYLAEQVHAIDDPTKSTEVVAKKVKEVEALVWPSKRLETEAKRKPPWRRWGMEYWGARYNAACFYSVVLKLQSINDDDTLKKHCIEAALEQLTLAMADPASADAKTWAYAKDTDLDELRRCKEYEEWRAKYVFSYEIPLSPSAS